MTITLAPQLEARLREKAEREGSNINAIAESLIILALEWEAQERAETIAGVQRGEQAVREGRVRPLAEFIAEQRVKHGFPATWPYDIDTTQDVDNAA